MISTHCLNFLLKRFYSIIILFLFSVKDLSSKENCFIAKDLTNNKILLQDGLQCKVQKSPASTFKIALGLIGFNEKILLDENNPKIEYQVKYEKILGFKPPFDNWLGTQTPKSWIENSVVWYSQILTEKLGMEKFQYYVDKLNYGNKNLSRDNYQNNGLTHSWLSSSLKISPMEQVQFLEDFLIKKNTLISDQSRNYTKSLIRRENLDFYGWKVYGKTGSGFLLDKENTRDIHSPFGWFIGFIEKDDRKIIFANYIEGRTESNEEVYLGKKAMESSMEKLRELSF